MLPKYLTDAGQRGQLIPQLWETAWHCLTHRLTEPRPPMGFLSSGNWVPSPPASRKPGASLGFRVCSPRSAPALSAVPHFPGAPRVGWGQGHADDTARGPREGRPPPQCGAVAGTAGRGQMSGQTHREKENKQVDPGQGHLSLSPGRRSPDLQARSTSFSKSVCKTEAGQGEGP